MLEQLYFSVVKYRTPPSPHETQKRIPFLDILKINELESLNPKLYVWGIWDIYPSDDIYRPPILSGAVHSIAEVAAIAKQYGLEDSIIYDNKHHLNIRLYYLTRSNSPLISRQKKGDKYVIGVWWNMLDYLLGSEPIYINENAEEAETLAIMLEHSNGNQVAYKYHGDYISNYIRKREAIKKLDARSSEITDAVLVNFVYADHLEKYHANKSDWKKHRIIRETERHIFVDKYPFFGTEYLRHGWRSRVIYTIMLDRKELYENGVFYHKSHRTHFFTKNEARKRQGDFFRTDDFENEAIYEIPINDVQWALVLLNIRKWPTTPDVITKAFRVAAMTHHPDRGGAAEMFVKCRTAQEVLLNRL